MLDPDWFGGVGLRRDHMGALGHLPEVPRPADRSSARGRLKRAVDPEFDLHDVLDADAEMTAFVPDTPASSEAELDLGPWVPRLR